tara:strand:- start:1462 stop:1875 length:414 start_codon:yes stop_codon:yes gene_type:complete
VIDLKTYVMPRPFSGYNIPISIQSVYLKDYANKKNFRFSLPTTEVTNSNNFYMLSKILSEKNINNLAMTSIFLLPLNNDKILNKIFNPLIKKNINLHFPLEGKILSITEFFDYYKEINTINNLSSNYEILQKLSYIN